MSESIGSVEEFLTWTKGLEGRLLLYRGLADIDWEVESAAYRRIKESSGEVPQIIFQDYIVRLLENSGLQGFRYRQDRELPDLELLAELQHYGAATCLIDFTTNALIALWFTCREKPQKAGKVVAMATGDTERFSTVSYQDSKRPIVEGFLNQGKLWKWQPSGLNNRIVAQQSVFVFGEGKIEERYYEKIEIDVDSKKDIIGTLEKSFGITERQLFNDFAGFAMWNAHDKPYTDFTAEDFFAIALRFQQQGDQDKAIEYYNKAIERLEESPDD